MSSPRTSPTSLGKGSRVVVTGRLEQRSWETEQGEKRSVVEIVADEVGPSLRWATAEVHPRRAPRAAATSVAAAVGAGGAGGGRRWPATAAAGCDGGGGDAGGGYDDFGEEPF